MNKTLFELGEEYLREAEGLGEKIAVYRDKLNKAYKAKNCDDILHIRRMLKLFYIQKNELLDSGYEMKNYYAPKGDKGEKWKILT